jgi:integrase
MKCDTIATIPKNLKKDGTHSYKVMIRAQDGFPPAYKTFQNYQDAKHWAIQEEARRKQGLYSSTPTRKQNTLGNLIDSYIENILPIKPKSAKDMTRHLAWWKKRLGRLPLSRMTSQIIAQCRRELSQEVTSKGTLRSSSTTNRYMASISSVFTYGVKELGWLSDNPSLRVSKLKEPTGRDRILTQEECTRLLQACRQSSNEYLYAIVLLALTTGARRGEIFSLTWDCVSLERGAIQLKKNKEEPFSLDCNSWESSGSFEATSQSKKSAPRKSLSREKAIRPNRHPQSLDASLQRSRNLRSAAT